MLYCTSLDCLPKTSLTNKCIVLDLDETLVHTWDEEDIPKIRSLNLFRNPHLLDIRQRTYHFFLEDVGGRKGEGEQWEVWGITRPHLTEFLTFCFSYFRVVAIWSAGQKQYVEAICDYIFQDIKRPHLIYSFYDCENIHSRDFPISKPLLKMIESEPHLQSYMSLSNTFVVDDRRSTFEKVNPYNGILIPEYSPRLTLESLRENDTALISLRNWFQRPEVMAAPDVRTLNKSRIFLSP